MKLDVKVDAIQLTRYESDSSQWIYDFFAIRDWANARRWDFYYTAHIFENARMTLTSSNHVLTVKHPGHDCWIVDFYGSPMIMSNKNYQSWQKAQS